MEIRLELNQRHGRGFQLRLVHGPVNKVYDQEPLTMYEAGACAGTLLDMYNQEFGTKFEPHQVLRVTQEGMEANAKTDFAAARMLQDIKTGSYELSTPGGRDFKRAVIDGEEQYLLSGRGTVLTIYFCWLDDKNEKARAGLRRYCEYIAAHGYRGGATKALTELDKLDKDRAVEWIRRTYARHVHDDAALIQYVIAQ